MDERVTLATNSVVANDNNINSSAVQTPASQPMLKPYDPNEARKTQSFPPINPDIANTVTEPYKPKTTENASQYSGMAIASMVLGIVGIISFFTLTFVGLVGLPLAIASSKETKNGKKGEGMRIAGLVLNILNVLLFILGVAFIVWLVYIFANPITTTDFITNHI